MIKTLNDFQFRDYLPGLLKGDPESVAIADALTPVFRFIHGKSSLVRFHDGIPDELLDYIAYEEKVDFYSSAMTVEQKRALIEKAPIVHQQKGTAGAVEEVAKIFFENPKLTEWFEYGGKPFFFKIETDEDFKSGSDIANIFRLIESTKNKRSRLEGIWFKKNNGIYFKVVNEDKIKIKPVMKFHTGFAMPGSIRQIKLGLSKKYDSGTGSSHMAGALFSGGKRNDVKTGSVLHVQTIINNSFSDGNGFPRSVNELFSGGRRNDTQIGTGVPRSVSVVSSPMTGDGVIDQIKINAGDGVSSQKVVSNGINVIKAAGTSSVGFCGKMRTGKGE